METTYRIYGINDYTSVIEDSLEKHDLHDAAFAIKMLLTEGITNAFKHGNHCDHKKSINVHVKSKITSIMKEVTIIIGDCGKGIYDLPKVTDMNEEKLLEEAGRGLFLIKHYSDKVQVSNNALHIYKKIQRRKYEIDSN